MGQLISIITSSDDNLETFSLLWLDASVNTSEDNLRTQDELRTTINQLKTFDNPDECEQYIRSVPSDDRIVLIVGGQLGRQIVPRINYLEQLLSIYIYCQDQTTNEQWSAQHSKVKGVVVNLPELIARIQFDHEKRQHGRVYETLLISIFDPKIVHEKLTTDLKGHLVHSQLLINCLLQIRSNMSDKTELITVSRQIFKKNRAELSIIREFDNNYLPNEAIWWYTRKSFVSRLLNKALRTQNIDVLFLFQFFIVDIREQLERIRCKTSVQVYRSQLMSKDELKKLKNAIGQFISINSFFSTTKDRQRAISYFEKTNEVEPVGLEPVLFEIDADPRLSGDKPFASIQTSDNKEEEILFMLGSIFQIINTNRPREGICTIQLKLCNDISQQFDSIDDENQLFSFGHVLMTMGKVAEAELYYQRILDGSPENHQDRARCYQELGVVANEKGEYDKSLDLHNKSLQINTKTLGDQHPDVASNYNSMGEIYRKKGDYATALEYHQKALDILGDRPRGKDLAKKAVFLNNMGIAYQEQQNYKEANSYYLEALKIRKDNFPSDETSLGISNNNIGASYYCLNMYQEALFFYQEALKCYKKTLPPQHPKFASTYNNIGAIYYDQNNLKDALSYYTEAAKIYRKIYLPTHPNVIKIEENIQGISAKVKK